MAAIDIGSAAADGTGTCAAAYTWLDKNNPADGTGTLTSVQVWANSTLAGFEVAAFDEDAVYATIYTTSGNLTIGDVASGSKQTFDISATPIAVNTGGFMGSYAATGAVESVTSGGVNIYRQAGDRIPCTAYQFSTTYGTNRQLSVYGTGATAAGGLSMGVAMHHFKMLKG